jgi:hypothetical protein
MMVRLYDLKDPRTANIRQLAGPLSDGERLFLLTVKP